MPRHHFTSEQWVPFPIEVVFAFFADPENLPRILPAWQKARIESAHYAAPPPHSKQKTFAAGPGSRMTISFRPFPYAPFRVSWIACITSFEWNESFCDEQESGPFASWKHCHRLVATPQNDAAGTLISDEVEYALPLGPLGAIANAVFVRRQLHATFHYRQQATLDCLGRLTQARKSPL
jgi:ligand-binding SRPBCC domain-containing protein